MSIATHEKVNRWFALFGVSVVSGAAFLMNAKYNYSLGSDIFEKYVMVAVSFGIDLYKFFGLGFIAAAFIKRKWFKGVAALITWLICVAYAATAAMGFATMTRSHVSSENTYKSDKIKDLQQSYKDKKKKYDAVNEEFETMKSNERYKSTAGCSVPEDRMTTASRYFCTDFKTKKEEVARKEYDLYKAEQTKPKDEFIKDADPQMSFFAKASGIPIGYLLQYWAIGIALAIELVSALGNFAVSPSRMKPERKETNEAAVGPIKKKRGRPLGSKNRPKLHIVSNI